MEWLVSIILNIFKSMFHQNLLINTSRKQWNVQIYTKTDEQTLHNPILVYKYNKSISYLFDCPIAFVPRRHSGHTMCTIITTATICVGRILRSVSIQMLVRITRIDLSKMVRNQRETTKTALYFNLRRLHPVLMLPVAPLPLPTHSGFQPLSPRPYKSRK